MKDDGQRGENKEKKERTVSREEKDDLPVSDSDVHGGGWWWRNAFLQFTRELSGDEMGVTGG